MRLWMNKIHIYHSGLGSSTICICCHAVLSMYAGMRSVTQRHNVHVCSKSISIHTSSLAIDCSTVVFTNLAGGDLLLLSLLYIVFPTFGYLISFCTNFSGVTSPVGLLINVSAKNLDNPVRLTGMIISFISPLQRRHVFLQSVVVFS